MEPTLRIRDVVRIVICRRRIVLGALAAVLLAAVLNSLLTRPAYRSSITIELLQPSGYVIRADSFGGFGGGRTTPRAVAELIQSDPYRRLAYAVVDLAQGYDLDLTARRTVFDMVALFETDLFQYPLPKYTGYLASHSRSTETLDPGRSESGDTNRVLPSPEGLRPSDLTSAQKEQALRQAAALAALGRRLHMDLFRMSAAEIETAADKIMESRFVRSLPGDPMRGKRWRDIPLGDRGVYIEAAYRAARKHRPDEADRLEASEGIEATELKETAMLRVAYESPDPQRAMLCVDAFASVVVWEDQYRQKEDAQLLRRFVEERLAEVRLEERMLDQRRMRFKQGTGIVDVDEETKARVARIGELQSTLLQTEYALKETERRISTYSQQLPRFPEVTVTPTVSENPTVARLRDELYQTEAALQSALANLTEAHPYVRTVQAKRDRLQRELRDEIVRQATSTATTKTPNPVRMEFAKMIAQEQAAVQALKARQRAVQQALDKEEQAISRLPAHEREMVRLARDEKVCQVKRELLEQRLMDARVNEATKLSTIRVVELALEPGRKVRPRRLINLVLGLVLGTFLGVTGALAAEGMDRTVRSRQEVRAALGEVPIVAEIPAVANGAAPSTAVEAYRALRLALLSQGEEAVRRLLVVPVAPGDNCGTLVAYLSESLAKSGRKVVVVDANVRHPSLHQPLGTSGAPGLADVLRGTCALDDAVHDTRVPELWLVPSGTTDNESAELLASQRFGQTVSELASRRDVLVLTTASAGMYADAVSVGQHAGAVLLVAWKGRTEQSALSDAADAIRACKARLLGVVLAHADLEADGLTTRRGAPT
ncbi:MAG: GumC family protein [Armatimonadota bacterium]